MEPLRDLLVIEINTEQKEKQLSNGLYMQPPKWAKPQNIAKVIAKGELVKGIEVDDFVIINPYAYQDTEEKNTKIIREKDVLCRILTKNL